ncbi:MAG: hypothetical protein ABI382_01220 [Nakamurella sp.]
MTFTDWFIDIALLLIVFRQFKEKRITFRIFILPTVLIGWVMSHYLHSVPTVGNDLTLIVVFTVIGIVFGLAGGLVTGYELAEEGSPEIQDAGRDGPDHDPTGDVGSRA